MLIQTLEEKYILINSSSETFFPQNAISQVIFLDKLNINHVLMILFFFSNFSFQMESQ